MMGNIKLFVAILFSIATMASAAEVISIDINTYGNDIAYSGEAAVPGATDWVVYYGGWGEPVGSPRSAGLAKALAHDPDNGDPYLEGTYAEQVWIGDPGGHDYIGEWNSESLLDDGFVSSTPSSTSTGSDPNMTFIGSDIFPLAAGSAYGGTYDVYLYSNTAGAFKLTDANSVNPGVIAEGSVTGTTSGFVEGENYIKFANISIADANSVRLWYSNKLNGIQLVSTRQTPKVINPDSPDPNDYIVDARDYDVAYDTNGRAGGDYPEQSGYGPDLGSAVHYLDQGEYMEYDISISAAAEGQYELSADVITQWGPAELEMYLDDLAGSLGTLTYVQTSDQSVNETNAVLVNIFEGTHTVKWVAETGNIYFDVVRLNFNYIGPIVMADCAEVYLYGQQLAGDITGDCRVDLDDIAAMAAEWTNSNDPQ